MSDVRVTIGKRAVVRGLSDYLYGFLKKQFTLTNPKWEDNKKRKRYNGKTPKNLYFYKEHLDPEVGNVVSLPVGASNRLIKWLKNNNVCHSISYEHTPLKSLNFEFKVELRDYQRDAVEKAIESKRAVLNMPTGGGKTLTSLGYVSAIKQPTLIIVNKKTLLHQWIKVLAETTSLQAEEIGIIGDGKKLVKPVTVAMVQTLVKDTSAIEQGFGTVVVDECHNMSKSLMKVLDSISREYTLGLSATPDRRDGLGKLIEWYCGDIIEVVSREELVAAENITSAEVVKRDTKFWTNLDASEEYSRVVTFLTQDYQRNKLIISDVVNDGSDGVKLLLTDRVDHVDALYTMASKYIKRPEYLTGGMSKARKMLVMDKLASGEIDVLVATTAMISEGFDDNSFTSLYLCSPIKYYGRLTQSVGRILRVNEGKATPIVYDYVDGLVGVLKASWFSRRKVYRECNFEVEESGRV